ncbi:hypothetical protein PVAG01_02540 [Phlyctema vagabunda]|uniref:Uncharacterized protein n=1 Tax=Phlyctema vagabunda TaxID=108571 RepID=A0ABR4PQZ1_9HELO
MGELAGSPKLLQDDLAEDVTQPSVLRVQEIDELVYKGFPRPRCKIRRTDLESLIFTYPKVRLASYTEEGYTSWQLTCSLENKFLPRLVMDSLRIDARKLLLCDVQEKSNIDAWKSRDAEDAYGICLWDISF